MLHSISWCTCYIKSQHHVQKLTCNLNSTPRIQSQSLGRSLPVSPTRALQWSLCQSPGSSNPAAMSRKFLGSWVHAGFLMRHARPRQRGMCLSSPQALLLLALFCSLDYLGETVACMVLPLQIPLSLTAPSPQPTVAPYFGGTFCPSSLLMLSE